MRKNRILLSELLTAVECSAQNANERLLEAYRRDPAAGVLAKPLVIRSMKVRFQANISDAGYTDFDSGTLMLEFCKSGGNFSCEFIIEPIPGGSLAKSSAITHQNKACKGEQK